MRNPYQRIVRDGAEIQRGRIDTHQKFLDVTKGIDLHGKHVLDIGCNLGEMCRLAKDAGASYVRGIDKEPDYIYQARELNADIPFDVRRAERATGQWDIALCVGMLHYIADHKALFGQLARITKTVVGDVWLQTPFTMGTQYRLSGRALLVPSFEMFLQLAQESFKHVRVLGQTAAPDHSDRFVFHLHEPTPRPARARLLYGKSGSGKTSRGRDLAASGWEHLELDAVFIDWRVSHHGTLSVSDFVDEMQKFRILGRPDDVGGGWEKLYQEYVAFHADRISRWTAQRQGLDVVIEGYDMVYPEYREMVIAELSRCGWSKIEVIGL